MALRPRARLAVLALVLAAACQREPQGIPGLGQPRVIAPGVELYRSGDSSLVNGMGPIAVFLLRLDPARVQLASALSNDKVLDAETVPDMAARHGALAAINGGFFNRRNGEPLGLLKVSGRLVSDTGMPRGALVIHSDPDAPTELVFDQLAAKVSMSYTAGGREWVVPIDGVDTTRARGRLMLYTPAYHADTDTAPTGTEWVLDGSPLRVRDVRMNFGHTKIPPGGAVLSFGGTDLPESLAQLTEDVPVTFSVSWKSVHGLAGQTFDRAAHIVNGAGLLRRDGRVLNDWTLEGLNPETFTDARHPRTVVGVDRDGLIWLVAVDGRQPDYSIGMTFADLQRLCERIGLVSALNLDGGGSTTMVVNGQVVNRPSDPSGARAVSDAILVTLR